MTKREALCISNEIVEAVHHINHHRRHPSFFASEMEARERVAATSGEGLEQTDETACDPCDEICNEVDPENVTIINARGDDGLNAISAIVPGSLPVESLTDHYDSRSSDVLVSFSDVGMGETRQDDSDNDVFRAARRSSCLVPDWFEDDDIDSDDDRSRLELLETTPCPTTSLLETFSDDVTAVILSHLSLREISDCAVVSRSMHASCRSNTLWKRLFGSRWNVSNDEDNNENDERSNFYFEAYVRAHYHPHDLWITHWNCVYPSDSISPGRCCIQSPQQHSAPQRSGTNNTRAAACWCCETCPNCRVNNSQGTVGVTDDRNSAATPLCCCQCEKNATQKRWSDAQAMARVTNWGCKSKCDETKLPSTSQSRRAFARAATFHRKLSTQQYEQPSPTNFLTDLLFFNLTDPATTNGQWELQQLLRETWTDTAHADRDDDLLNLDGVITGHHSWHVCKFYNPDFVRPILYQIGIMRKECITVYPAEGYIEPGGAVFVTIGVRPFGSAMAYAFEALNIFRDGLSIDWSDLYTEEAHLPMAPILIRYHYCITQPVNTNLGRSHHSDPDDQLLPPTRAQSSHHIGPDISPVSFSKARSITEGVLDYHRRQHVPPHHMRSIYLSAHVNAHYHFTDFLAATCTPWNLPVESSGPIYASPLLREEHPGVYRQLQNMYRAPDSFHRDTSHTEGPCTICGKAWGAREEELVQAYLVAHTECASHRRHRQTLLRNIVHCLRLLTAKYGLPGNSVNLSSLFYVMCCIVQSYKGSPWTTRSQKLILMKLEVFIDRAYEQIPVGGADWMPWCMSGCYRYATCTESVFGMDSTLEVDIKIDGDSVGIEWKDEPEYLDSFRHIAHSPGQYCLGPQEDPNHLGDTVMQGHSRYYRQQVGCVTDIFGDNPISAFQAGICMIRDPRSLLVHGIYDLISFPGAITRRPKLRVQWDTAPAKLPNPSVCFSTETGSLILQSKKKLAYYWVQDGLDFDGIVQNDASATSYLLANDNISCALNFSFHNFLRGIPPPGVGRFALSREILPQNDSSGEASEIGALLIETDQEESSETGDKHDSESEVRPNVNAEAPGARANRAGNIRPPRFLHLLWALGAQVGLALSDSHDASSVFVERNILIASQWVSVSFMAAPLFYTLCARYWHWIPTEPLDYKLQDFPFPVVNEMRFLTDEECGCVAAMVFAVWLALARWTERHTNRDFFRVMLEHVPPPDERDKKTFLRRFLARLSLRYQRQWDAICPLFLQRRVFAPHWNVRTRDDLMKHIAYWRSRNLPEQQSMVRVSTIKRDDAALFGDCRDEGIDVGSDSSACKLAIGLVVALCSFCSSSPHFWLNLITVFSCSISLGMSVSLHSLDKGRLGVGAAASTGSMVKSFTVVTIVITAFLMGQMVGSSGGTLFLAEFIVTSISLLIGGTGTISASAMESWGCFFCLFSTSFWGYLLGRVALLDGIRQRRGCNSSILLSLAVLFLVMFWVLLFFLAEWDAPVNLVAVRPDLSNHGQGGQPWSRDTVARKLQ